MDERFYFNPYLIGTPISNVPPNMVMPPNVNLGNTNEGNISPKEFYENGYQYYRYLNELMDYQIKSRQYYNNLQNNQQNK